MSKIQGGGFGVVTTALILERGFVTRETPLFLVNSVIKFTFYNHQILFKGEPLIETIYLFRSPYYWQKKLKKASDSVFRF